jgi:hypothetical protein
MDNLYKSVKLINHWSLLILALFLVLVSSPPTYAQNENTYLTYNQELFSYIQNFGRQLRRECPDRPHTSVSAGRIDAAFTLARQQSPCVRVQYYLGIIEQGNQQQRQQARREIISAYIDGGDVYGAMNSATFYVGLYGQQGRESEAVIHDIRFQILQVSHSFFATHPGRDPFWEKMLLGIHSRQSLSNPLFQFYRGDIFLRDYPRSPHRAWVQRALRVAQQNVDRHYLEPNKHLRSRREWKAIIVRMAPIWSLSDESVIYPAALEESVEAFIQLALQVRTVGQGRVIRGIGLRTIDENRIRQLLELNPGQPIDYAYHYNFLMEQAAQLVNYMERTLPGHAATRNAQRMLAQAQ